MTELLEYDNSVTPKTLLSDGGLIAFIRGGSIMLGTPTAGVCYPYDYISSIGMGGAKFEEEKEESPFPLFEKCHTIQSVLKNIPTLTEKLARCFIPMKQGEKWLLMNFKTKITSEQNIFLSLDFLIDPEPITFKGMSFYQRGLAMTINKMMNSANVNCHDNKPCKLTFEYNEDKIVYSLDSWTQKYDLEKIPLYFLFNEPGEDIQLPICAPRAQEKISDKFIDACYINCMDDEWAVERHAYLQTRDRNSENYDKTFEDVIYVKTWDMYAELTTNEKIDLCRELGNTCNAINKAGINEEYESKRNHYKNFKDIIKDKLSKWVNPFKKKKATTEENLEEAAKMESIPIILAIADEVSKRLYEKFKKEKEEENVKKDFFGYYVTLAEEVWAQVTEISKTSIIWTMASIIGAATIYGIGTYFGIMEKEDQTIQDEEDEEEPYNLKF
tara:strand:- start:2078 stop:3403 length:1326 start_codon:yes stop_codon:yes gene_type:complete